MLCPCNKCGKEVERYWGKCLPKAICPACKKIKYKEKALERVKSMKNEAL